MHLRRCLKLHVPYHFARFSMCNIATTAFFVFLGQVVSQLAQDTPTRPVTPETDEHNDRDRLCPSPTPEPGNAGDALEVSEGAVATTSFISKLDIVEVESCSKEIAGDVLTNTKFTNSQLFDILFSLCI